MLKGKCLCEGVKIEITPRDDRGGRCGVFVVLSA
jgi:hypothetical protein